MTSTTTSDESSESSGTRSGAPRRKRPDSSEPAFAIEVAELKKTFKKPFSRKRVEAVRGVSFRARVGEIFGFLGPNGAGKTTTIKMVTGLIRPTSGSARIMGVEAPSPRALERVGFLPENPYVYPYLTPREFVTMGARLSGLGGSEVGARVERAIVRAGMGHAIDRPVRALSKGMLQRVAIAAALVHDPDVLILDEPMSGLDPVGRLDVRDLILEEADRGRTVFFSSHILSDVEMLCDRVCILREGRVVVAGKLSDLLENESHATDIRASQLSAEAASAIEEAGFSLRHEGNLVGILTTSDDETSRVLRIILDAGGRVHSLQPQRKSLEALFFDRALDERSA